MLSSTFLTFRCDRVLITDQIDEANASLEEHPNILQQTQYFWAEKIRKLKFVSHKYLVDDVL